MKDFMHRKAVLLEGVVSEMLTNIGYTDKIRQGNEGEPFLQQANHHLENLAATPYIKLAAEWDRTDDEKGSPLYSLRLVGGPDSAAATFTPDDLAASLRRENLLTRLWRQFLQTRIERLLKSLYEDEK